MEANLEYQENAFPRLHALHHRLRIAAEAGEGIGLSLNELCARVFDGEELPEVDDRDNWVEDVLEKLEPINEEAETYIED